MSHSRALCLALSLSCGVVVTAPAQTRIDSTNAVRAHIAAMTKTADSVENGYWRRIPMSIPPDIALEVGGLLAVPGKRLLVATLRGEIWWVDGAYDANPKPRYTLFASGLHDPLGLAPAAN